MAVTKRREDWLRVIELNVKNIFKINDTRVLSTATELNILDGATLSVAELNKLDGVLSSTAELNLVDNQVASVTYVIGAEGSDIINVGLVFKDAAGVAMATPISALWYLADDTAGLDPATAAPDQGIAIGTDGALIESVANLSGLLVSEANGSLDIDMEDAAVMTKYMVVVLPNGSLAISSAITWA